MPVGKRVKAVFGMLLVAVFCLALLETLCRFLPKSFYEFEYRYLYYSRNALRNVGEAYWTYAPDSAVRSVTIYKYPGARAVLEGDVTLTTNSLGLVQRLDPAADKKTIALLGDSFTEGQLCDPWFYSLEETFPKSHPGYQLMNLGLMGTGPRHWELLLNDIRAKYGIEKILVIFIQNDFERGVFAWDSKQLECIDKGLCNGDYWYGIDPDTSQEDIIAATSQRERDRHGRSTKKAVDGFLRRWLYTYRYIRATLKSITDARAFMTEEAYHDAVEKNLAAVRRVVAGVGRDNVVFLSVSSRPEAERHAFEDKTATLLRELADMTSPGQVHTLLLAPRDFFEFDGHPNQHGYAKIKDTVSAILSAMAAAPRGASPPAP